MLRRVVRIAALPANPPIGAVQHHLGRAATAVVVPRQADRELDGGALGDAPQLEPADADPPAVQACAALDSDDDALRGARHGQPPASRRI